jgi:hypothetical protein
MADNAPTSQPANGGNRDYRYYAAAIVLVIGSAFAAAIAAPTHKVTHTIYKPPAACQHAATATLNHLHALADSVGVHVTIKAIHTDMAGLQACR